MVAIDVRSDLDWYSLTAALDSVEYRFVFHWNTRDEHWYMDVELTDGTPLVNGRPIVVDTPLLVRWTDDRLPDGFLLAVDSTGEGEEPLKEDFGDRVKLVYLTENEVEAL